MSTQETKGDAAKQQRKEKPKKEKQQGQGKEAPKKQAPKQADSKSDTHLLGITVKKADDFSDWYSQVLIKSQMIDYYDISGCYILRPWAFSIWEQIQKFFDARIKKLGVENAYFPLLVSQAALNTEKSHIEGFSAEVAWVTKSGSSDLAQHVAIRPTSETIMYPAFAQWIRSHRDLPLKMNQWTNVVRWEFKRPVPFLRSREFLWQEGHTVHATLDEAAKEVLDILDIYSKVYEELLAVPVHKGFKSEGEKFAGGYYTTTCEAFIPTNGRAVQAATSHCLGQNFSKMFNITFEDVNNKPQFAWQNSWGLSTRAIGVLVMVHGDDKGLVLPPRVAPIQVVVIPISFKNTTNTEQIEARARELTEELEAAGIRVKLDDRSNYHPGWKYNHWELKGVPLRIEIGPKDYENKTTLAVRRDTGAKTPIAQEGLATSVKNLLEEIQANLLATARKSYDGRIQQALTWEKFMEAVDNGFAEVPWCEKVECEESTKKRSGEESKQKEKQAAAAAKKEGEDELTGFGLTGAAKSLCIPLEQKPLPDDAKCFSCGAKATKWAFFGRSY